MNQEDFSTEKSFPSFQHHYFLFRNTIVSSLKSNQDSQSIQWSVMSLKMHDDNALLLLYAFYCIVSIIIPDTGIHL